MEMVEKHHNRGSVYYTDFTGTNTELIIRDDSLDFGIAPYTSGGVLVKNGLNIKGMKSTTLRVD